MGALLSLILSMLLCLLPAPAAADWSCDGDLLRVETVAGAVDPTGLPGGIPNTSAGTLPGDGVLIHWRDMTLQLPRTNNAGAPSYTDGRWWWRVEDPLQPEFLQRRGTIVAYDCQPLP